VVAADADDDVRVPVVVEVRDVERPHAVGECVVHRRLESAVGSLGVDAHDAGLPGRGTETDDVLPTVTRHIPDLELRLPRTGDRQHRVTKAVVPGPEEAAQGRHGDDVVPTVVVHVGDLDLIRVICVRQENRGRERPTGLQEDVDPGIRAHRRVREAVAVQVGCVGAHVRGPRGMRRKDQRRRQHSAGQLLEEA
jgi:hypothetical protein